MQKNKPKFNHVYTIRLTDQENELLSKSAAAKEIMPKDYIISLIVFDNLRNTWHRNEMEQTQQARALQIFNNGK